MTLFDANRLLLSRRAKLASSVEEAQEPEQESHLGRNAFIAAAGLSPFAGMIGQGGIKHDPHANTSIPRFSSLEELGRVARPGDMILASKPGTRVWNAALTPMSGSHFYHAQPVVDMRGGKARTVSAAEYSDKSFNDIPRHKTKPIRDQLSSLKELKKQDGYDEMVILRPKVPLTPEQLDTFREQAIKRSRHRYGFTTGVSTALHDMFVPKFKMFGTKAPANETLANICSTLPAMSYAEAGRDMIDGIRPHDVTPTAYLRSGNFEAVGAHVNRKGLSRFTRNALPIGMRAAVGAGLAGGAYAVSQDPYAAAAPLGVMAGSHLANKLFNNDRSVLNLLASATEGHTPDGRRRARFMLTGKALGSLAGGAAAYYGARGIGAGVSKLKEHFQNQNRDPNGEGQ